MELLSQSSWGCRPKRHSGVAHRVPAPTEARGDGETGRRGDGETNGHGACDGDDMRIPARHLFSPFLSFSHTRALYLPPLASLPPLPFCPSLPPFAPLSRFPLRSVFSIHQAHPLLPSLHPHPSHTYTHPHTSPSIRSAARSPRSWSAAGSARTIRSRAGTGARTVAIAMLCTAARNLPRAGGPQPPARPRHIRLCKDREVHSSTAYRSTLTYCLLPPLSLHSV